METSIVLGLGIAAISAAISAVLLVKCRSSGRSYPFAVAGWVFLAIHSILRAIGVPIFLREILIYLFALSITLHVLTNIIELRPENARLLWTYTLIPTSHVFYRILEHSSINLPAGVGGIAGDSGVMLLITAYISYVTFRRVLLSIPLVPIGIVLLFYKVLQGTLLGFSLMAFGITVFALATVHAMRVRLFKGGTVPEVETTGLVLVEGKKLKSLLEKYRNSSILLLTREEGEFPENWSVFRVSAVPFGNSIPPTALEKLRHVIVQYLLEARKSGSRGVVVIDCLDFLLLYNDRLAVLKFLGDVRDHAIVNDGVVFVGLSESVDEQTRRLLENLSDGKI